MNRVSISDIYKDDIIVNSLITVCGWVRNRRSSKSGFSFITIYDGSCFNSIQVIANNTLPNYYKEILHLTTGCSVMLSGKLILSIGDKQKYEIQLKKIKVLGWVENPETYPISSKKHSTEYLREVAHLRSRTNLIGAIARIRNYILHSLHHFFYKEKYYWVPTPIITSLNTEGAGEMFRVSTLDMENIPKNLDSSVDFKKDFFGKESFLTVSGQLNLETYACSLSKVYTFGPTFRAENSNTGRHLAEFWMLEVESAFTDLNDISDFAECMLKYVCKSLLKKCITDINFLENYTNSNIVDRLEKFLLVDFVRIDYVEVINILLDSKIKFNNSVFLGIDLSSEHERFLVENYFKIPVIVKNYPKELKAFYMRLNNDKKTVAAIDILVPNVGELIGGSQREERIAILDERLLELGLKKEDYWWYRDLRRYGTVPHSGFGMGFERLISYFTGITNIRDLIPFPRTVNNAYF
ncbi:asparagine--tRNA ligase [Buchnera aphidicola str. APS (Acyrthosiphon pisum)]|uniref:Asparagine--tRNA ligase n=1 Tax=Buchnera aphidicola subsp. Acyrthosiphon pisum (strain APS) TaxID=107806 RepID=SYN_BUCAI|nr:asparagine--tRNA ligase [Buchnera aphidicola]P57441.1 RecName: Full=Asparagine--tRNA ligase; AltName: Full=Asparaginyl-tRNA synthetase; Short=AsnRS [Buchnera aphidicola str. APS (Acyrthosiphon pisum)]pir/H84971/ asparagine-tRNA ligase (EC 6.1.1.22) [imported] - Buchnera sp. (strain APS) [Buchnera sp. (in: enterobacteria)]BAB13064.1 asparaginyl-tRNA synthetase [Buchnera aphidicola str. APS (Acyrthosiphon pisum)]